MINRKNQRQLGLIERVCGERAHECATAVLTRGQEAFDAYARIGLRLALELDPEVGNWFFINAQGIAQKGPVLEEYAQKCGRFY